MGPRPDRGAQDKGAHKTAYPDQSGRGYAVSRRQQIIYHMKNLYQFIQLVVLGVGSCIIFSAVMIYDLAATLFQTVILGKSAADQMGDKS
jgi:hypothetical protein